MNWNWKVASTSLAQNEPNGLAPSGSPLFRSQDPKIVASSKASGRFSFQGPREHAYLHSGAILLRSTGRRTLVAPPPFVKLFFVTACFFLEPKHQEQTPLRRPCARRRYGDARSASRGGTEKLVARPEEVKRASPICLRIAADVASAFQKESPRGLRPAETRARGADLRGNERLSRSRRQKLSTG